MSQQAKYTLKPAVSEKFDGIVWKIAADADAALLGIECRNQQMHTASFSLYSLESNSFLFKDLKPENSWDLHLDCLYDGIMFMHTYSSEAIPQRKGIIAYGQDGKLAWQNYSIIIEELSSIGLVTRNPAVQSVSKSVHDPKTGNLISTISGPLPSLPRPDITVPSYCSTDMNMLSSKQREKLSGPVLFMPAAQFDIFCFHLKEASGYSQHLIFCSQGSIIHDEILESEMEKLNPEGFFRFHQQIFCIRNKKEEILSFLV